MGPRDHRQMALSPWRAHVRTHLFSCHSAPDGKYSRMVALPLMRRISVVAACALIALDAFASAASAAAAAPRPNSAVIPQLNPGFMARHDEFLEIAKQGDIDILFLGDSITDWWRHPGAGFTAPPADNTPRRGGAGVQGNGQVAGRGRGAPPADGAVIPPAAAIISPAEAANAQGQVAAAVANTANAAATNAAAASPTAANRQQGRGNGVGGGSRGNSDIPPVPSLAPPVNTSPAPVATAMPADAPPPTLDTPLAGKPVFEKYFGQLKVANFAIAGDTTQGLLWRLQNGEGSGFQPKAIMLMIGTNNLVENTAAETAEGITAVVQELRKDFPAARILLLGIFPRSTLDSPVRAKLTDVNARIAKLHDNTHVFYQDLGPKFLEADGRIAAGVMSDGLHPTMRGYEIWANAVKEPLAKLAK
jgi:lysophospholipase L1-like esterase